MSNEFIFHLSFNQKVLLSPTERNNVNNHNTFLFNNGIEDTIGSIPLLSSRNNVPTAEKSLVENFDNYDDNLSQEKNYFSAKDNNNSN